MQETTNEPTDLREYLRPVRARWWLILVIAAVAAVGTYRYYQGKPVYYVASSNMYMVPSGVGLAGQGGASNPNFIPNQAILLRTEPVAAAAARLLGYKGDPGALLGSVSAGPESGTDFMTVTGIAPDPVDAGRIANAFAQAYITTQEGANQQVLAQSIKAQQQRLASLPQDPQHADQRQTILASITQLQLAQSAPAAPARIVQPAGLGSRVASDPTSHAIYGLVLGLLIGVALAFAMDALDRRVKRLADLEAMYEIPVLARVPWAAPKIIDADPRQGLKPPLAESFRALRTNLQMRSTSHFNGNGNGNGNGKSGDLRTILVASAVPGEGKSTIVRNLAVAYLEGGKRVVVVDCDLRRPDVTQSFGVEPVPGLPEILSGEATIADSIQTIEVSAHAGAMPALQPLFRPNRRGVQAGAVALAPVSSVRDLGFDQTVSPTEDPSRLPELAVLPSASPAWNPAAIFGSGSFALILQQLKADYDVVILDTPPLTVVSDALPLLPLVDGVLIVSRVRKTPVPAVLELKSMLGRVPHTNVVGLVANDMREHNRTYVYSQAYEAKS